MLASSPDSLPAFFRKMRQQAPVGSEHHDLPQSYLPLSLQAPLQFTYGTMLSAGRPKAPILVRSKFYGGATKRLDVLQQVRSYTVSIDRLKPALVSTPPSPRALPSSRPPPPPIRPPLPRPSQQRVLSEDEFPPLPPSKPFITRAGHLSVPPSRFSC